MSPVRLQWPALRAGLESHTVQTGRGLAAGYLVRCTGSRRELGYVWQAGNAWQWRAADGQAYGERSSLSAAVTVLRQIADVGRPVSAPTAPQAPRRPRPNTWALDPEDAPAAPPRRPQAAPPPRSIVWPDAAPDLTAFIKKALDKQK